MLFLHFVRLFKIELFSYVSLLYGVPFSLVSYTSVAIIQFN